MLMNTTHDCGHAGTLSFQANKEPGSLEIHILVIVTGISVMTLLIVTNLSLLFKALVYYAFRIFRKWGPRLTYHIYIYLSLSLSLS